MTIEIKYAFDNPVDYSYDAAKVEVAGGVSRLKLAANPAQVFNEDFADDTGFTYDGSKLSFAGGLVEQKTVWPVDSSWAASFATTINSSWGDSPTLVPISTLGSPTINAGKLDLRSNKNAIYNTSDCYNSQVGAIRIKYTPDYSGSPASNVNIFTLEAIGGRNGLYIQHNLNGQLYFAGTDNLGSGFSSLSLGPWVPTLGQEYELELDWDFPSNIVRLFIDGILFASGARSPSMDGLLADSRLILGGLAGSTPSFQVSDVIIYKTVQHTAGYTPGYDVIDYANNYGESSAALPSFVYSGQGAIQSFDSLAVTATSAVQFTVNGKWWDGGAWSISDGSYAQSSSPSTINMHIGSMQVSNSINVVAVFPASNAKESIDDLSLNYTGQAYFTGSTIIPNAAVPASSLGGFITEETDLAGTSIRYAIEVDTVLMWWNGSSWVPSSGAAETNTAQEVNDNAASLALSPSGSFVRPLIYFITDGSGTSELEAVTVAFVYDVNPIQAPSKTVVFGSLRDIIAEPFSSASLRVENAELFFKTGTAILPSKVVGNTNDQAVAYVELVRTGPDGYKYSFYIDYYDAEGSLKTISLGKSVAPDDEATNIATLTFE